MTQNNSSNDNQEVTTVHDSTNSQHSAINMTQNNSNIDNQAQANEVTTTHDNNVDTMIDMNDYIKNDNNENENEYNIENDGVFYNSEYQQLNDLTLASFSYNEMIPMVETGALLAATTIFVGDLAFFCTEEDLRLLFLPFSPTNVKIMRNSITSKSMQYGYHYHLYSPLSLSLSFTSKIC